MAGKSRINFEIGFVTDSKGLGDLKRQLEEIRKLSQVDIGLSPAQTQSMIKSVNDIEHAMNAAFDVNLNTINVQKFQKILAQSGTSVKQLKDTLDLAGPTGQKAFLRMSGGLMQFNTAVKQSNQFLDKMATTFANSARWTITSTIIQNIIGSIRKSYNYIKDLDTSLNDIRIVTGKSADEMSRFAVEANAAAKELAVTTKEYTEGSLIYYQQGLDDETVKTLTDVTAKTSNVTGQAMSSISEQLTAVWNGYQVANRAAKEGMDVYEEYVDKMAAVGASTASNLEELSTAMSKVASAASSMGVGFDDLNAQIATIVSVTRQAPESVGTALKTIYARLGDLKVDGVDEFGTKLGEITSQLQVMGINVVDTSGEMRDMSSVMAEVAEKWDTWTSAQRQAAAVAMAGKRQYNNLIALFDNWDMYGEALKTSMEAAGTLEEQQEVALDSLKNKTDQLIATTEDLYQSLYNEQDIKNLITGLTKIVQLIADFSKSIGGLSSIFTVLGSTALRVFNNQIANGLSTIIMNTRNTITEQQQLQDNYLQLRSIFSDSRIFDGSSEAAEAGVKRLLNYYTEMQEYANLMNEGQQQVYKSILNNIEKVSSLQIDIENTVDNWNSVHDVLGLINEDLLKNEDRVGELSKKVAQIKSLSQNFSDLTFYDSSKFFNQQGNFSPANVLKEIQKMGTDTTGIYNKVKYALEEAYAKTNDWKKAIELVNKEIIKTGERTSEVLEQQQQVKVLNGALKETEESFKNGFHLEATIANITSLLGVTGQLASSLMTIKNLGSIWSNENIDMGTKILQTFMNIGFALPGLVSAFGKLNDVLSARNALLIIENANEEVNIALKEKNKAVSAMNLALGNAELKCIQGKVGWLAKECIAQGAVTEEQVKEVLVSKNQLATDKNLVKAIMSIIGVEQAEAVIKEKEIILKNKEILASKKLSVAQIKLAITTLSEAAARKAANREEEIGLALKVLSKTAILGVVAAATVAIAIVGAYAKAKEKEREEIIENNKARLDEIKANQEIVNSNKTLVKSYSDLYKQYQTNKNVKKDLYDKTLELAEAYNIEDAKILALGDRYDELTAKIKAAREEELKTNIKEAQEAQEAAGENAQKQKKNISSDGYYYRDEMYVKDSIEAKALEMAGFELTESEQFEGNVKLNIQVDFNNPQEILKYKEQLEEANDIYKKLAKNKDININESNFLKYNRNDIKELKESTDEIEKQREIEISSQTELVAKETKLDELSRKKITNLKDYENEINIIREKLKDFNLSTEEENNYIKKAVEDIEGASLVFEKIQFIEKLVDSSKGKYNFDDYAKTLEKYNSQQVAYIVGHLDTSEMDGDLEKWINIHNDDIIFSGQMGAKTGLQGFLSSFKSGEGFSTDDIDSIFADPNIAKAIKNAAGDPNLTAEIFKHKEAVDQLTIATRAYIVATKEAYEGGEEYRKWLETHEAPDEETERIAKNENAKEITKKFEDSFDADEVEKAENAIKKLGNAYKVEGKSIDEALNELSEDDKKYIEILKEQNNISNEMVAQWGIIIPKYKEAKEEVDEYATNLEFATTAAHDFKEEQAKIAQELTETNKVLDDLQSKFKSLVDIVSDYNETGHFTIDNVQALMEMEDSYVASLDIETNSIEMNEEAIKANTIAQLEHLKSVALDQYLQKLQEIQTADTTSALYDYAVAAMEAEAGVDVLDKKVQASTEHFKEQAQAARDAFNARAENQDKWKQFLADESQKAFENKMTAIEDIEKEVLKGGYNLRTAMGAQTQADKDKDKQKNKKDKEEEKYYPDYYYDIGKAIDAVDRAVKQLDKDQEKLYGKAKIKSLKQENELIAKQVENLKAKYEIQKKEAEDLRGKLSAGGMTFSNTGEITNYNEALASATERYNEVVRKYNEGLADDNALQAAKTNLDEFKKYVERYDKLFYTEMKDTLEKIKDEIRKQLANNLEAWQIKIDTKLETKKLKREWNSFLVEIKKDFRKVYEELDKEMAAMAKNFKTYTSKKGTIAIDRKAVNDVTKEIDKMLRGEASDKFENVSQAQEELKKLNTQLQEDAKAAKEVYQNYWDDYLKAIDQVQDKYDKMNEQITRGNDLLEFRKQIVELVYGSKAFDTFNKINRAQLENNIAAQNAAKVQYDTYSQLYEKMGLANKSRLEYTEDEEKIYQNLLDAQERLNDLIIEGAEKAREIYDNTLNKVIDELEKKLTGGKSFDELDEEWERMEDYSEEYYDNLEKAYQTQKLSNKIQKEIDSQTNLKNQQKLKKLQEYEITLLQKKEKMTKYDLEAAEARYNIALKEIALEEAQNNKNAMKLVRNSQGNWAYQYVADQSEVADKEQELSDALMDYRNLNKERLKDLQKTALQIKKNYIEELSNLENLRKQGEISDAEYTRRKSEAYDWVIQRLSEIDDEYSIGYNNLLASDWAVTQNIYYQDEVAYANLVKGKEDLLKEFGDKTRTEYEDIQRTVCGEDGKSGVAGAIRQALIDSANESFTRWDEVITDTVTDAGEAKEAILNANTELENSYQQLKLDLEAVGAAGAASAAEVDKGIKEVKKSTSSASKEIEKIKKKALEDLPKMKNKVDELATAWDKVTDAIEKAIKKIEEYLKKNGEVKNPALDNVDTSGGGYSGGGYSGGSSGSGSGGNDNQNSSDSTVGNSGWTDWMHKIPLYYQYGVNQNNQPVYYLYHNNTDVKPFEVATAAYIKTKYPTSKYNWIARSYKGTTQKYDTGGYTGTWSGGSEENNGRWAMLHQKELVLNAKDTENFLEGINVLRDLTGLSSSIEQLVAQSIAGLLSNLAIGSSSSSSVNNIANNNNNSNQVFNINAEFPNANNVDDIKAAILSLPNIASQYINRNRI